MYVAIVYIQRLLQINTFVTYLKNLPQWWAGILGNNGNTVEDKHKDKQKFSKQMSVFC